ncbi:hypothetical protein [Acanthopleuribacter pedis]|uniref:Uncharacterized protein n=1 Tax=Acanthopleuribacter pedis TaxID=442870 RepID=A0A8J7U261_9BACT|nr:hypothetical protein [Acanthopleuribacter pedis]MBO1318933.1 hypothetical protein [Acanthopleuribacter pedis]
MNKNKDKPLGTIGFYISLMTPTLIIDYYLVEQYTTYKNQFIYLFFHDPLIYIFHPAKIIVIAILAMQIKNGSKLIITGSFLELGLAYYFFEIAYSTGFKTAGTYKGINIILNCTWILACLILHRRKYFSTPLSYYKNNLKKFNHKPSKKS